MLHGSPDIFTQRPANPNPNPAANTTPPHRVVAANADVVPVEEKSTRAFPSADGGAVLPQCSLPLRGVDHEPLRYLVSCVNHLVTLSTVNSGEVTPVFYTYLRAH